MTIYSMNTTRFQTAKSPQERVNGAGSTARASPARAAHNPQLTLNSAQFSDGCDGDERGKFRVERVMSLLMATGHNLPERQKTVLQNNDFLSTTAHPTLATLRFCSAVDVLLSEFQTLRTFNGWSGDFRLRTQRLHVSQ